MNSAVIEYTGTNKFAEGFEVSRRGIACIDQEVAVLFRNLRAADTQAAASGSVNDLPG